MARKGFNIRTALRMMPQELLGECFQEMEVWDQRIAWFLLLDNKVDPILNYLCEISSVKRDEIETFLRAISDLACDSGYEAILESAPLCAVWDLPGEVPTDLCLWGRTMWVWLHRRNIFDKAQLIHRVETLPWWRKRNDLPQIEANTSAVARDALANEISEMLREEGRGKQCTVEYMHHDGTTYFFAYADDYLQNLNVHNEEGKLIAITQRQTLQVAFSFNGDQGTLQTFAKLRKPFKERLEKMFSRNILAYDLARHEPEPAYELEHLKGGMRNLEVDPADEIQVSIRRLRLASGAPWRRVMVEIDGSEREYHMDIAVPDCLNLENIPLNNWGVSLVGFCFEFLPKPGRKPGRTSFDIVYPHSNNLRDVAPERLQIIEKICAFGESNVSRLMSRLLSRWSAKSPIIDATEVQAELRLALSALCDLKILRPTAPAAAYTCSECGDRQPLTYLSGVDDQTHAYLHCQGCGVYEVNGDLLRRWEIATIPLLEAAFQGLQLAIRAEVSGQLWQIGKAKWASRIREVWFVRGSSLEQADQVARALKSRPKAIVFCPTEASVTRWSERLPNLLLALESTLSLGETGISFDTGYVESRIVDTHAGEISPTERRRPQMRGVRLADIEKLCDALVEHIKSAKEYASHVAGKTGTSELWPRLTQEGLGVLVKFRKYRVNRCLNDSRAERLRDLWEDAQNLDQLMPLGKRSQGKKKTA